MDAHYVRFKTHASYSIPNLHETDHLSSSISPLWAYYNYPVFETGWFRASYLNTLIKWSNPQISRMISGDG